jgi:hypothetical protein
MNAIIANGSGRSWSAGGRAFANAVLDYNRKSKPASRSLSPEGELS